LEHSWGRNVVRYGLGDTGCSLAARELRDFPPDVIVTNQIGRPGIYWAWVLPDTEDGTYFGVEFHEVGFPHFPGDLNVEPDEPV